MSISNSLLKYFAERKLKREKSALEVLKARYHAFRIFLENNGRALELIVSIDDQLNRGEKPAIRQAAEELLSVTGELVDGVNLLSQDRHVGLYARHGHMAAEITECLDNLADSRTQQAYCLPLDDLASGANLQVGAKAANLARLRGMALPVPNGFVCNTEACRLFLNTGELADDIRRLLREVEYGQKDATLAAGHIREMILAGQMPQDIAEALSDAYRRLAATEGKNGDSGEPIAVSVRSSGVSEDGSEHSFAGQFKSILNVRGNEALLAAYREVVASGFSARAIVYRLNAGLSLVDFDLAVLCQVMVQPHCAGVMLTRDPSRPESGRMLISAAPGMGTMAVDGSAPVDLYRPLRLERDSGAGRDRFADGEEQAARLMDGAEIAVKTMREVSAADGGLRLEPVAAEEASLPLLPVGILAELLNFGETIEGLAGIPQDVEWAYSQEGGLAILQARPLRMAAGKGRRQRLYSVEAPVVSGICAAAGNAVGRVQVVHSTAELDHFEKIFAAQIQEAPCILVLPQSIVDAARLLQKCAGVIIDTGNPTDHLSCIAREYGIPMLTGARQASSTLRNGQWLILDADQGLVLDAPESIRSAAIIANAERQKKMGREGPTGSAGQSPAPRSSLAAERQKLREIIVPLNLTDAYGSTFSVLECRSIHDIVRYTHEMAVLSMFDAGDTIMEEAGGLLRPLDIGVPFSFLVIDVGGGVRRDKKRSALGRLALHRPLTREDIISIPLTALCEGLTTPGLNWHTGPDVNALPGIFSRTLLDERAARPAGSFNYALAARDYLNLNARVEFHFAMLDTICGRDSHANYIRFRFKGGGAGLERRHRRAAFLRHVLEGNAFYTAVSGDLVTASLTGATKEVVYQQLVMLGRLLGFSRFLDGVMTDDDTARRLARTFLAGHFDSASVTASGDGSGTQG